MNDSKSSGRFNRGYVGPEVWLTYLGIARIGVLVFLTIGAALIRGPEGAGYLLFLYIFGYATAVYFMRTLHREGLVGPRQNSAQIIVDFGVVALTVSVTQGPTSFFTFIFVIVVLEAGLLLGLAQSFVASTAASLFMLLQVLFYPRLTIQPSEFELWYNFLVQCLAFYLTAFISGYWNQRMNRMRQFQREILNNLNSGFLITDAEGLITFQNRAAAQILDIKNGDATGRPVADILKVASGGECPVVTALRSGTDFTSYEFRAATGQGEKLLGLTTNRMETSEGEVSGIIASFSDLTFMDQMRQEMRRQDRMAVVGELAAGLAHEIRNPVAVIRGAVDEMGSHTRDDGLLAKLYTIALRESDHLNEIVSGFLDFAREPEVKRETFDIRELVNDVAQVVRRECAQYEGLRVETVLPGSSCPVSADYSQIRQVFVNLGKNAAEAMNGPGLLQIRVTKDDGPVKVHFEDEGPGIPPDKVDRIFEPFYTTKKSGVGMGLAVCLRIVTAHDGTIHAASREGGGSTMTVSLPPAASKESRV